MEGTLSTTTSSRYGTRPSMQDCHLQMSPPPPPPQRPRTLLGRWWSARGWAGCEHAQRQALHWSQLVLTSAQVPLVSVSNWQRSRDETKQRKKVFEVGPLFVGWAEEGAIANPRTNHIKLHLLALPSRQWHGLIGNGSYFTSTTTAARQARPRVRECRRHRHGPS